MLDHVTLSKVGGARLQPFCACVLLERLLLVREAYTCRPNDY